MITDPTALVVVALAIAWRWEWAGAVLFVALGTSYILMTRGKFDWLTYSLIPGPLFLIGVLFLVGWFSRREVPGSSWRIPSFGLPFRNPRSAHPSTQATWFRAQRVTPPAGAMAFPVWEHAIF